MSTSPIQHLETILGCEDSIQEAESLLRSLATEKQKAISQLVHTLPASAAVEDIAGMVRVARMMPTGAQRKRMLRVILSWMIGLDPEAALTDPLMERGGTRLQVDQARFPSATPPRDVLSLILHLGSGGAGLPMVQRLVEAGLTMGESFDSVMLTVWAPPKFPRLVESPMVAVEGNTLAVHDGQTYRRVDVDQAVDALLEPMRRDDERI